MGFGKAIRRLRREREFSQDALAAAAHISRFYLIQIEKDRASKVSIDVMDRIARALGKSLGDLCAERVA